MLEHIFLDLDDTLLDFTQAEAIALTKTLTEMDAPAQQAVLDRYHVINQRQWELLEEGVLTRAEVLVSRFEILFRELGLARDPEETCRRYEGHLAEGHIFLPGAPELLAALAPRYKLLQRGCRCPAAAAGERGHPAVFSKCVHLRGDGSRQAQAGVLSPLLCRHPGL